MRTTLRHAFGLLVASLVLGGCSDSRILPVAPPQPKGAHLSTAEVIRIAKGAAVQHGNDLSRYEEPNAHYDSTGKEPIWLVLFDGKVARPGNHLMVVVDDETGKVRLVPGK
jgi:hypothetical protein